MSHMIRFRSDDSPTAKAAFAGGESGIKVDPDPANNPSGSITVTGKPDNIVEYHASHLEA